MNLQYLSLPKNIKLELQRLPRTVGQKKPKQLIAAALFFVLVLFLMATRQGSSLQHWNFRDDTPNSSDVAALVSKYLREIKFNNNMLLDHYDQDMSSHLDRIQNGEDVATSDYLSRFLQVSEQQIKQLKSEHFKALKALPKASSADVYSGDGVVSLAGGRYFPAFLVALRQLRQQSPSIPVELFFYYLGRI